jgi:single-strand DNA-binding protein
MFKEITVIGNLGNDPEIRHLPSGTIAGSFSVAVNDPPYTDRNTGEIVKKVTWIRFVAYQTGESGLVTNLIQKWLHKGQLVFCKGDPTLRRYIDQQGIERTAFEVKLGPQSTLKMLGSANGRREANGTADEAANGTMAQGPHLEKGDPGPSSSDADLGDIPI